MLPKAWRQIASDLKILAPNDRSTSTATTLSMLPSSTYVRLTALASVYENYYLPSYEDRASSTSAEQNNFRIENCPAISKALIDLVFEGFKNQISAQLTHPTSAPHAPKKPVQRSAAQDAAILDEIKNQGLIPTSLPKRIAGKLGVKATIKAALGKTGIWVGPTVFNKAWEHLRSNGDIAESP